MERESKRDKIEVLLEEIIQLIAGYQNMNRWIEAVKKLLNNYVNLTYSADKKEAARLIMQSLYRGMGSFSDTFLSRGDEPLIEENDRLIALRHELYKECLLLLYPKLSSRLADTFINSEYKPYELDIEEDILYQYVSSKGAMGKFFCKEVPNKLTIGKTVLPIRPEQENLEHPKFCRVKISKGTLLRLGRLASQENRPKQTLDIYIDKPWREPKPVVLEDDIKGE